MQPNYSFHQVYTEIHHIYAFVHDKEVQMVSFVTAVENKTTHTHTHTHTHNTHTHTHNDTCTHVHTTHTHVHNVPCLAGPNYLESIVI